MKLLIDISSVLGAYLHLPDPEFGEDFTIDGRKWHVPALETCMERAEYSLQGVLDRLNISPSDIIAVRDPESPGAQRKRFFPGYKAGREKRPPQFYTVLNQLVEDFCELIMKSGGVCATPRVVPSIEADDLLNTLAEKLPDCIIYSRDKDLLACPARHHLIDKELDPVPFPVPREFIHLYRAIVTGDASDNVPGCKGFGEKAWEKMVDLIGPDGVAELDKMVQEKRLHELEEDVAAFKPFRLLIDKAEDVYLSYKVMSFIPVPDHKIKWEARCQDCSKVLVTAGNYEQALKEVRAAIQVNTHSVIDFETDTPLESDEWKAQTVNDDGKGGVGVDVIASEITGMGLKIGTESWYFSVDHAETDNITLGQLETILKMLRDKPVYAHNSTGFENVVMLNHFGWVFETMVDTILLASYVNENDFRGLKHLSKRDLNYIQATYEETLAGRRGMRDVTGEEVLGYGIDDVVVTDTIQNLYQTILAVEGSLDVFYAIEQRSSLVTSVAFWRGVEFDEDRFHQLKADNDAKTIETRDKLHELLRTSGYSREPYTPLSKIVNKKTVTTLYKTVTGRDLQTTALSAKLAINDIDVPEIKEALLAGHEVYNELYKKHWQPAVDINVRSPKQMTDLLYVHLGAPVRIYNAPTDNMRDAGRYQGNPSSDDEAVANAIAFKDVSPLGIEILETMTEYKACLTKEGLYFSKYPKLVHWKTGKLHCSMTQCGASTRRFTHSNPNLSQISKKKGKEVRDMIKAGEDEELGAFDHGSQELRLQAEDCGCPEFQACYLGDKTKDVHSATGFQVGILQGVEMQTYEEFEALVEEGDKVAKQFRADGKATNFATSYGCKPPRLAHMLAILEETAKLFIDAKGKAFPGLVPYVEKYNALCRKRGYSETFMGARRHLAKLYAMAGTNQGKIDAVNRLAWSFRIQGSGAEVIKLAMSRAWDADLINEVCWVAFQVHDELVFCFKRHAVEECVPRIHEVMVGPYADMRIPMVCDPSTGTHFGSLKKWEFGVDK